MTTRDTGEPFKIGTIVKIRGSGFVPGPIVEFRGPLGPGGMRIYSVCIRKKPRPAYIEVREDQLEEIDAGLNGASS